MAENESSNPPDLHRLPGMSIVSPIMALNEIGSPRYTVWEKTMLVMITTRGFPFMFYNTLFIFAHMMARVELWLAILLAGTAMLLSYLYWGLEMMLVTSGDSPYYLLYHWFCQTVWIWWSDTSWSPVAAGFEIRLKRLVLANEIIQTVYFFTICVHVWLFDPRGPTFEYAPIIQSDLGDVQLEDDEDSDPDDVLSALHAKQEEGKVCRGTPDVDALILGQDHNHETTKNTRNAPPESSNMNQEPNYSSHDFHHDSEPRLSVESASESATFHPYWLGWTSESGYLSIELNKVTTWLILTESVNLALALLQRSFELSSKSPLLQASNILSICNPIYAISIAFLMRACLQRRVAISRREVSPLWLLPLFILVLASVSTLVLTGQSLFIDSSIGLPGRWVFVYSRTVFLVSILPYSACILFSIALFSWPIRVWKDFGSDGGGLRGLSLRNPDRTHIAPPGFWAYFPWVVAVYTVFAVSGLLSIAPE